MKKILFILSLFVIVLLIKPSEAQHKTFYYTRNVEMELKSDSAKGHLAKLFNIGLYDSAIVYCNLLRSTDALDFTSLESALATAYQYKGNTGMAYQYVINSADYSLKLNGGGGNAFAMLENYEDAYPLASDTVLEQIIATKVKNYYLAMDYYANPAMGLKFIMLYHALNKAVGLHRYLTNKTAAISEKQKLQATCDASVDSIYTIYKSMLDDNDGFYSAKDIGNAFTHQFWLINQNADVNFHNYVRPYYDKALQEKKIETSEYVDGLMNIVRFKEKDITKQLATRDSLCVIYGCAAVGAVITEHGDTMYFKQAPAYIDR